MTDYFDVINSKSTLKSNTAFSADGSRPDLLMEQYQLSRASLMTPEKVREINDLYMKWCDQLFSGFNVVVVGAQSKYSLLETFKKKYLDSERIPDFRRMVEQCLARKGIFTDELNVGGQLGKSAMAAKPESATSDGKVKDKLRRGTRVRKTIVPAPKETSEMLDMIESNLPLEPVPQSPVDMDDLENNCPMLNILTVRIHGLEPIKMEAFSYALFTETLGMKTSTQKPKEADLKQLVMYLAETNQHCVFLIHSFEYFQRDSADVCELIFKLYAMDTTRVHLLMSSDLLNAGKRLDNLKIKLNLAFSVAPFSESYLWEKTELMNEFDEAVAGGGGGVSKPNKNDTTFHRLLNENMDLQSLKDIYQALDGTTASILKFIMQDYLDKCQVNQETAEVDEAADEEDERDADFAPSTSLAHHEDTNRMLPKREARARVAKAAPGSSKMPKTKGRKKPKRKKIETDLDFHHLLNHCESQFIVRRGAALRDHLGELKDHSIISDDQAGNKIKCLIEPKMCRKFLAWTQTN